MELVENLRHLATGVHALRWVLLFIVVTPIVVTWAIQSHAARTRLEKRDRAVFIDPFASHPFGCKCIDHR